MEATLALSEPSGVAEARRTATAIAQSLGFSEKARANAALVVSEAATNILKYASHGEICLRPFSEDGVNGLEMLALDNGPGIANLDLASRDGYSSSGSLGAGLGTMARHSTQFDIYSREGQGTAVLARVGGGVPAAPATSERPALRIGYKTTPKAGQEICGDAWGWREVNGDLWITLLDGLGHGPLAAEASRLAVDIFNAAEPDETPASMLKRVHAGLKTTRGAVMAVAMFDRKAGSVRYAGVGNIVGIVHVPESVQHLISTDGTVGYNMRTVRESELGWNQNSALVVSTDGLSTRWNLSRHPGLMQHHPSLIAAVLHRDFARDNDDATVLVVKAR